MDEQTTVRIASYTRAKEIALDGLDAINGGMRFYMAVGTEPYREYTDERRAELNGIVEMMDKLIELVSAD